jgi:ferrous iron transport protein B
MSARTIQNKKERLITILVTPLMSCSARLPVYTILISLVIPNKTYLSIFNLQGLVLMALYLLGFVMALLVSKVLAIAIKVKERSYFLMEMPIYRAPRWSNIGITMIEKAKVFVLDAGKVILVISLLLWFLASYGPSESMHQLAQEKEFLLKQYPTQQDSIQHMMATKKLAHSYVGILGKTIEPLIQPLGFDWKIGIALITSFAAREVFVGTMATLYSVGEEVGTSTLEQKMQLATHANGSPVYTLASGVALLLFYVFAMQCMSTLAVVKRETQSWRYPIFQLFYMSAIAYATAWLAYTLLA